MSNTDVLNPSKGLAITYLVRLGIGSPSGGRSEIENLNVIKKIREGYLDFPYASSQAMKRALRDTLKGLGFSISPVINASPARTAGNPKKYIDDDLFGFMDPSAKKESKAEEGEETSEENISENPSSKEAKTVEITKEMMEKLKLSKKAVEVIKKYFSENPEVTSINKEKLQELEVNDTDIKKIIKAVTKDETASLDKMLQNLNSVRKSVVSMTPLLSLSKFDDNVDFGANMMGLKAGASPMPYETEVHRGWYRISLYIDLDRIGTGDGFIKSPLAKVGEEKPSVSELLHQSNVDFDFIHKIGDKKFVLIKKEYSALDNQEKYRRAKALLDAILFLAPSGRSSNWLIDLTPKLMVAAFVKGAKTPFLESPLIDFSEEGKNRINIDSIETAKETFADGIEKIVVGYRKDLIENSVKKQDQQGASGKSDEKEDLENPMEPTSMKSAFDQIDEWLKNYFEIN